MEQAQEEKKSGFMQWLTEDDSPDIGIATKEPLDEYFKGVQSEFKKIQWPSKEQMNNEFVAVIVIVAIISSLVFVIDIGLDNVLSSFKG